MSCSRPLVPGRGEGGRNDLVLVRTRTHRPRVARPAAESETQGGYGVLTEARRFPYQGLSVGAACSLVVLSCRPARVCALLRSTVGVPRSRSAWRHRSALISPHRDPVSMVNQSSSPQAGSAAQASLISSAASSGVGGSGSCLVTAGGTASSAALTLRYRQRTARARSNVARRMK